MVDWKEFVKLENYREGTPSQRTYDKAVDELLDAGVLSLSSKNKYFIYFTKRKDAKEYAEIKYSDALFPVGVHRNT